jgi:hypothetical protein
MSLNSLVDYTFAIDLGIGAVTHAKTQFIHQTPLEIHETKSRVDGLTSGEANRLERHGNEPSASSSLFLAI